MSFKELVAGAKVYFPNLQIKYKNESWVMKALSKICFLNHEFMTHFVTTIGDTVYFPSEKFVKRHSVSSSIALLHELVHIYDQKRVSKFIFIVSYLFPQILVPICLFLFALITWKIMLPATLLCMSPIPAFFRMYWEKRAYLSSFYVMQILGQRMKFNPHLKTQENIFLKCFHGSFYYYMWPFHDIDEQFNKAIEMSAAGKRPFADPVFDVLDDLVSKV